MKTVVSQSGVEVLYPCSIHLLTGEILECEYKSDQMGHELMDFVCDHIGLPEKDHWGFKFLDCFEQRHWLDLNKLIRIQMKNVCPIQLLFRLIVYPPESYKLEEPTKTQIFVQLRLDLKSGRLCCGISDASLLLGLLLQFQLGDYNSDTHVGNYVKDKFLQHQPFVIEMKAIAFHREHLSGINKHQTIDLFLRLASQLETYGVDPFLVEDCNQQRMTLWVNYKGMSTYVDAGMIHSLEWMSISRIKQDNCSIFIHLVSGHLIELFCLTKAECNYIYEVSVNHLRYFTTSGAKSTTGVIGSDSFEDLEEEIKSVDLDELGNEVTFRSLDQNIPVHFCEEITNVKYENISASKLLIGKLRHWRGVALLGVVLAVCLQLYLNEYKFLEQIQVKSFWNKFVKGYWNK